MKYIKTTFYIEQSQLDDQQILIKTLVIINSQILIKTLLIINSICFINMTFYDHEKIPCWKLGGWVGGKAGLRIAYSNQKLLLTH